MSLLDIRELLKFSVRLEENGEAFYRKWAEKAEIVEHKNFFTYLADEEVKHKRLFTEMIAQVDPSAMSPEVYDEYIAYLRGFTDETLFNEKVYAKEMNQISGLADAVEFAMRQELDSVLFYLELKTFVPKDHELILEGIVNEERRHYATLLQFKRDLPA